MQMEAEGEVMKRNRRSGDGVGVKIGLTKSQTSKDGEVLGKDSRPHSIEHSTGGIE